MVLLRFSCTTILSHHSQHLVCICFNILLNVEDQVQYQHLYIFWQQNHSNVEIHYQCHLCSSSIPLKHCQSSNHLVCCVYVLVAFLQFSHQWFDRFQRDEKDGERQNVLKCSLMVALSQRLMQCHICHCSLRLHRCMLVHGSFKYCFLFFLAKIKYCFKKCNAIWSPLGLPWMCRESKNVSHIFGFSLRKVT